MQHSVYYSYFSFRYKNETEIITSRHWGSNIPVNCRTEHHPYLGSPCIFPFEYKEKTYYECIPKIFGNNDNNYWCPTELDFNDQPYNWGRCGENCPSSKIRIGENSTDISPKFTSKLNLFDGL